MTVSQAPLNKLADQVRPRETFRCGALGLIGIGILHLVALGSDASPYFESWLRGIFWTWEHWRPVEEQQRQLALSGFGFWSSIASPAVPVGVLGSYWAWQDSKAAPVARFGPAAILLWATALTLLMPTGGFVLIAITAAVMTMSTPKGGWA